MAGGTLEEDEVGWRGEGFQVNPKSSQLMGLEKVVVRGKMAQ